MWVSPDIEKEGIWNNEKDNEVCIRLCGCYFYYNRCVLGKSCLCVRLQNNKGGHICLSASSGGTYELVYRLSERMICRLARLLAGWFFMRIRAEYPKQTLNCGMMEEAYAAVYGRLHGMRIM